MLLPTEKLRLLATTLLDLASDEESAEAQHIYQRASNPALKFERLEPTFHHMAKAEYRRRRQRESLLPAGLFSDPAWDMLLDLFVHHLEGKRISVTSLCIASGVPSTTALRYIKMLERERLIESTPSKVDNRVRHLGLTETAYRTMCQLMESAIEQTDSGRMFFR